jgi:hypothetical protein
VVDRRIIGQVVIRWGLLAHPTHGVSADGTEAILSKPEKFTSLGLDSRHDISLAHTLLESS